MGPDIFLSKSVGFFYLSAILRILNFFKNTFLNILPYIGLIPSEHSSGEKENRRYMTRRGNSLLRKIIVESSWTAVRKDPGLLMSFNKICKRHTKSRAIITIARKYAARIMHVLKQKEEYKFLAVK